MQKPQSSTRASVRRQMRVSKSCSECRRRKQKCTPSSPGKPCSNCAKRWPVVECIFPHGADNNDDPSRSSRLRAGNLEVEVTSSRDFEWRERSHVPPDPMQWSVYLLPVNRRSVGGDEDSQTASSGSSLDDGDGDGDVEIVERLNDTRAERGLMISGQGFSGVPATATGGLLAAINCVNSSHVENTARNTELMYFFIQFVAPNMVSLDGQVPFVFRTIMLPWMLQSHVFPNIAILMASVVEVMERGKEAVDSSSEPLTLKVKVLAMLNQVLSSGQYDLSDVLRSVINLVILEFFSGAEESMWAHLRGLKMLVNNRGGPTAINDPLFAIVLILADYMVACAFETDLCVQDSQSARKTEMPYPTLPDDSLACPLGKPVASFKHLKDKLHLTTEAATILDDVQFLTLSITSSFNGGSSPGDDNTIHTTDVTPPNIAKIRSTASWLHKRLQDLHIPTTNSTDAGASTDETEPHKREDALVTETIRLAALVYTKAIMSLRPISRIKDGDTTKILYDNLRTVSSDRWKRISGVFLWLLVVATPHVAEKERNSEMRKGVTFERDFRKKYLRWRMGTAAQVVGQEEFSLAIWYLRSFWLVQRWIVEQREKIGECEGA